MPGVLAGPIYRAPMRARAIDVPAGAGASFGVEHGVVGTGDALDEVPGTVEEAVMEASARHGEKAGRMLKRFAELANGSLVWTELPGGEYRLGMIQGSWRYDDSLEARAVGIHHVRSTRWLPRAIDDRTVPAGVAATFARGGRNLQRVHDTEAERATAALWNSGG